MLNYLPTSANNLMQLRDPKKPEIAKPETDFAFFDAGEKAAQ